MAKFGKDNNGSTPTKDEAPAAVVEPVMAVSQSNAIVKAVGNTVVETDPKKDDPEITHHPTKDYTLGDNENRINGKRQFLTDPLCRQLCCTMYLLDAEKLWMNNPAGGAPLPVVYTREFPEVRILYDNFDLAPNPEAVNLRRDLAHKNRYRYLFQHPGNVLTTSELTKQLEEEDKIAKTWK